MNPSQPLVTEDGTTLDPKVVKVMRATRSLESSGQPDPYNATGDSGNSHGAYQFNEKTGRGWKAYARDFLGDENAQMTPANQNKVVYSQFKKWKDEGRQPEEIDALWNGAQKDEATGTYKHLNPQRAEKFRQALGMAPGGNNVPGFVDPSQQPTAPQQGNGFVTPPPVTALQTQDAPPEENKGLVGKLLHGAGSIYNSIASPLAGVAAIPVQGLAKAIGAPDPFAQGIPSIAGKNVDITPLELEKKAGDVAQTASYFVPGTGILGAAGMGALQGAGASMSKGEDASKVATSGGIGAVLGGGLAGASKLMGKGVESVGENLSGEGEKKAVQGIKDAYASALNLSQSERAYENRSGKDLAEVLMKHGAALGRYENGTLDASHAINSLQEKLAPLNEQAAQVLKQPQGVVRYVSLPDAFRQVQGRIQNLPVSQVEKNAAIKHAQQVFGAEIKQHGHDVTPEIADQIKQGLWGSSFKGKLTSADKLQGNVSYLAGNTLKKEIEKSVAGTEAGNVLPAINEQRSELIDAIKRLSNMDGVKLLKGGRLGNIAGGLMGTIIGSSSGGALGGFAGDYFGTRAAEFLNNPATKIAIAKGKRKAVGMLPTLLGSAASPIGKGVSSVGRGLQNTARPAGLIGNLLSQ